MDYGQRSQLSSKTDDFFTSGVGDIPADQNTYEKENNLDLANSQIPWGADRNPNEELRALGNRVISSPKNPAESRIEEQPSRIEHEAPLNASAPLIPEDVIEKISYDASRIRTDGDRISKSAVSEVSGVISEFTQTGNAADFYATIRGDDKHPGMVRANLKNSYNREVA